MADIRVIMFLERLDRLGACNDALEWVAGKTLEEAWATCHYPGWMIWLAARVGIDGHHLEQILWACCREARYKPSNYCRDILRWSYGIPHRVANALCYIIEELPCAKRLWITDYLRQKIDVEEIGRLIDG